MGDNLKDELDETLSLLTSISFLVHRFSDLAILPANTSELALATASAAAVNQVLRGALTILSTETKRWGL